MRIALPGVVLLALLSCIEPAAGPGGGGEAWPGYEHQTGSWHRGDHTGTVGLPYHSSLTAHCTAGRWYFKGVRVTTGQLPPGLRIDHEGSITGVPEQEGTWHCSIAVTELSCDCGMMQQYLPNGITLTEGFFIVR